MVQKILNGTWSQHLVGAPGRGTSYQHESSGSGGGSSRLPTPQTGNMITHTHSHYTHTHTERHPKNPKDKSFGKKGAYALKKRKTLECDRDDLELFFYNDARACPRNDLEYLEKR